MSTIWQAVDDELKHWRDAGLQPKFWLRDDDAIEASPALSKLLALCEGASAPLLLAVIPKFAETSLVEAIAGRGDIQVAVHGWAHQNHAPDHEKKQELGDHRPVAQVIGELSQSCDKLRMFFSAQYVEMLVPPWNRISPQVIASLPGCGFTGLSTFGRKDECGNSGLVQINSQIDLMNWKSRSGKSQAEIAEELVRELKLSRSQHKGAAIGILGHHLVHDDTAWQVLEQLLALDVTWCGIGEAAQEL